MSDRTPIRPAVKFALGLGAGLMLIGLYLLVTIGTGGTPAALSMGIILVALSFVVLVLSGVAQKSARRSPDEQENPRKGKSNL